MRGMAAMDARVMDISLHGCYIDTTTHPPEGSLISLAIQMPSGRWLAVRGEVLYSHPNIGFAIRFVGLSDEAQSVLGGLISSLR